MSVTYLATLADVGSGIPSGTSNPGSPTDGEIFFRSDLDLLIRYHSSGTQWLCVCPHNVDVFGSTAVLPFSATQTLRAALPVLTATAWLEKITIAVYVNTTNTGSAYWNITSPVGNVNTSAIAANSLKTLTATTAASQGTADNWIQLDVTKTGSPGTLIVLATLRYRFIVT